MTSTARVLHYHNFELFYLASSTAPIFVQAKVSFAWFGGGVGFGGAWTWTKPLQAVLVESTELLLDTSVTVCDCISRDCKWKDVGRGSETFKSLLAIWIIYSELITSSIIGRILCWKAMFFFSRICQMLCCISNIYFVVRRFHSSYLLVCFSKYLKDNVDIWRK